MVSIETLMNEGKVSRIRELEVGRYVNFFENSYNDNLEHCKADLKTFPRWSIISGYYAMHDITKLLIAKKFGLKIELPVHTTTIKVLRELVKEPEVLKLIERGYKEFISLANDLADAKDARTKAQYYTGTPFMREHFQKVSEEFFSDTVSPYVERIRKLLEEKQQ